MELDARKSYLVPIAWLAMVALLGACEAPDDLRTPWAARVDSIGAAALDAGPIAGLSIAIARAGDIVFERGYGVTDLGSARAVNANTVYNVASTGKILAAAGVMKLVESERLKLDDTLESLIPDRSLPERASRITMRQLISMTSGLPDYVDADLERWATTRAPLTPDFVLEHVRGHEADFEPGAHWMYSNTGFYLAGLVVERITGRPWGEYVVDEIARPLDLTNTWLCDDAPEVRSRGYEVRGDSFIESVQDQEQGVRGDAGLCSSATDMARLPTALATAGVLSASSLATMTTPTRLSHGSSVDYGLGVSMGTFAGHRLWGHVGGAGSIVSALAHYPDDDLTVAVLINTRRAGLGALEIEGDVARAVLGVDAELADLPVDPTLGRALAGTYAGDREGTRYQLVHRASSIWRAGAAGEEPLKLLRQDSVTFGRTDWPFDRFVFHVENGRARGFSVYYNGFFDGLYRRVPAEGESR